MWSKSQIKILPITFLIVAAMVVLLTVLLHNKDLSIKSIPLKIIALAMLIGEVVKISLSIAQKQFTTWQVPLHYCSMFILWFFLCSFFTKKSRDVFYGLSIAMGIPVMIVFLLMPSSMLRNSTDLLFNNGTFYHYHNFFYHIFIFLFVALIFSLRLYKPKMKDFKYVMMCFYLWVVIATIASNILNESYANLLYSDFAKIDQIRTKYSYILYLFLLYIAGFIAVAGTYLTSVLIGNVSIKRKLDEEFLPDFEEQEPAEFIEK